VAGKIDLIMGLQYGDEGKGKIVSTLTHNNPFGYKYGIVAKYNGGSNAGHSVNRNGKEYAFHLIPSGILEEGVVSVIGNGVVLSPEEFVKERDDLIRGGLDINPRNLVVSEDATITMPHHQMMDLLEDLVMCRGTTGKGIGPTYRDKVSRDALKVKNLYNKDSLKKYFELHKGTIENQLLYYANVSLDSEKEQKRSEILKKDIFRKYVSLSKDPSNIYLDCDQMIDDLIKSSESMKPHIKNTAEYLYLRLEKGVNMLAEGSQAAGLDIEGGSYPYTTSSNCGVSGLISGLRINPNLLNHKIGVVKLVPSRVGEGPFPTALGQYSEIRPETRLTTDKAELQSQLKILREKINQGKATDKEIGKYFRNLPPGEFGTTTGRPRATGWLDLRMVKRSAWENGIDMLALTKIDSYVGLKEFKVCLGYKDNTENPEPIYQTLKGFKPIHGAKKFDSLPQEAKDLVGLVEKIVRKPAKFISTGPKDEHILVK